MSIGDPPAEVIEYYINRTLQRNDKVSNQILKEDAVFAISGTEDLHQIVPKGEKVLRYSPNVKIEQSFRVFEINNAAEFEKLSNAFQNIHWLQKNGEFLQWLQSKGSIQTVKKHLLQAELPICCNNFVCLTERLVVLIAEPGMGKSTLMSYIAREIKKLKCNSWVIKINLNDVGEYLSGNLSNPVELLEKTLNINGDFQKSLFQISLDVVGNIILFLDGFDEICPYYADQIISLLQKLLRDTKIEQIWISARPIMKEKLEDTFCALSYALKPFSETDQKAFLRKFWQVEDIEEFAVKLLNYLSRWTNDKLGEFTGIPLQTMMLAVAFREEMLHYTKTRETFLPERLDILQLYEKFIDIKLKIYFAEKLQMKVYNNGIKAKTETMEQHFYENHMICGILSIFSHEEFSKPHSLERLKEKVADFLLNIQQGKENASIIMSVNNGKPTFIHRTFAEYFAAMWLVENYSTNQDLVEHILFLPTFDIVRIFFDRSVTRDCILHVAVLNEDKYLVKQLVASEPTLQNSVDKCGRTPLHLAVINYGNPNNNKNVKHSRLEILETIVSFQKGNLAISDKLLRWTPLKYADKIHAWQAIDLLLQEGADEKDMEFTYAQLNDTTFLSVSLRQILMKGYKKIIEYLICCKPEVVECQFLVEVDHMEKTKNTWVTALHEASLRGHRDIVELLIDNEANLEALDGTLGETPLLWAAKSSHWDIFHLLISKGADIRAISRVTGANVIHFAAKFGSVDLLEFLIKDEHLWRHINASTLKCSSPVLEAAKAHKWVNVRLLLDRKVNTQYIIAPNGDTLLHFAVKSADSDILYLLLEYPEVLKQLNSKNVKGETPVESAARAKKWDLVNILLNRGATFTPTLYSLFVSLASITTFKKLVTKSRISKIPVPTCPDEAFLFFLAINPDLWFRLRTYYEQNPHLGDTLLHWTVKSKDDETLNIALNYFGPYVDTLNKEQESPFMCAARVANMHALERLLEHGADPLLMHPTGGYTALHLAAECDDISAVTFLLKNTKLLDDIDRRDAHGKTPLMRALPRKHGFGISQCLLESGAECSYRYENGESLVHAAAKNGIIDIGLLLVDRGLSPLERDANGRSPLHVAANEGKLAFVEWLLCQRANANEMDNDKLTPLLCAIMKNHKNCMDVLLKYGADANKVNKLGQTPLHLAAFSQGMVEVLLKWGADPNIPDYEGRTPLHYAAYFESYPVIMLLVMHGVDPKTRDSSGKTPYSLALEAKAAMKIDEVKRTSALRTGKLRLNLRERTRLYFAMFQTPCK